MEVLKLLCFLISLATVSNVANSLIFAKQLTNRTRTSRESGFSKNNTTTGALHRKVTLTSGHITKGRNASDITIRNHGGSQEIIWEKDFNNLKYYFMQINEISGKVESFTIDNVCNNYGRNSIERAVNDFVLQKLAKTDKCPIKKGTVKMTYPMNFEFQVKDPKTACGPIIAMFNIVRKNPKNSDVNPLLINIWYRGIITADDCK